MRAAIACLVVLGCSPGAPAREPARISDPMELASEPDPSGPFVVRDEEVRVFGSYDTVEERAIPGVRERGTVTVKVERLTPQVLVLCAYEPARWVIKPAPGARLRAVIVTGYHAHEVDAPRSVRVIDLSGQGKYL